MTNPLDAAIAINNQWYWVADANFVGLGVSICLDRVLIETLDLNKKKLTSTVKKISTLLKS
jgi:hypothetical protein